MCYYMDNSAEKAELMIYVASATRFQTRLRPELGLGEPSSYQLIAAAQQLRLCRHAHAHARANLVLLLRLPHV